jgi:hypothetical protein
MVNVTDVNQVTVHSVAVEAGKTALVPVHKVFVSQYAPEQISTRIARASTAPCQAEVPMYRRIAVKTLFEHFQRV